MSGNMNLGFGMNAGSVKEKIYIKFQGYSTVNGSTYEFRQSLQDAQSPYEFNQDYGSAIVGANTIANNLIFRTEGFILPKDVKVKDIAGWFTLNTSNEVKIATCYMPLVDDSTAAQNPELIQETIQNGVSNQNTQKMKITELSTDSFPAGGMIFPMLFGGVSGNVLYFNMTLTLEIQ